MSWKPFSNEGELQRHIDYDPLEDRLIVKSSQDIEHILNANKELQKDPTSTRSKSGEFRKVASVPNIVIEQWLQEGINFFDKADWPKVKQKLNSSDYLYLRTDLSRL